VFGKHTLSLKVGIVGTEAQAQLGLVGPIDNPRTFFFFKSGLDSAQPYSWAEMKVQAILFSL